MDTKEILEYMKFYPDFLGVFPLDHIPETHRRPCSMIINTDVCTEPGTHWVALYLSKDGSGEYFDSFGLPPLLPSFWYYLSKACPKGFTHNSIVLQDINATTCGLYAIVYLKLRHKGFSSFDIISAFSRNTLQNEKRLHTWDILRL